MVTPTKEAFPQSDAQLFDYFAAVQDGCALPIVLQDHPAVRACSWVRSYCA